MSDERLRDELEKLHEALADVHEFDEATVNAMKQVASDIDRVLEEEEVPSGQVQDLRQRIDDLVLEFETKHPRVSNVLSQLTDLLAGMGI